MATSETTCRTCGVSYPAVPEFFHRDSRQPDGLRLDCRTCRNTRLRTAYRPGADAPYSKGYRHRTRLAVLEHYGGDPPACACCGEHRLPFLAIDHVDGNGKQHHKTLGPHASAYTMYRWIVLHGFPDGFRVLCHNCNLAIGFYGICPHEAERATAIDAS